MMIIKNLVNFQLYLISASSRLIKTQKLLNKNMLNRRSPGVLGEIKMETAHIINLTNHFGLNLSITNSIFLLHLRKIEVYLQYIKNKR